MRSCARSRIPFISRKFNAYRLRNSLSACCAIGLSFRSCSGARRKRARQRSTAKGILGGRSLRRGISYFAARIVNNPPVTAPATKIAISVKTIFHRSSAFMIIKNKEKPLKAIFFDAVGTLFYLTKTVGDHYALVGREIGLTLDAQQLDRALNQ